MPGLSHAFDRVVHHPRLGIELARRMSALGISAVVGYPDNPAPISQVDFILHQFKRATLQRVSP